MASQFAIDVLSVRCVRPTGHIGRKLVFLLMSTHQTLVYIEPDTDADRNGEPVHLSDGTSQEHHLSLPDGKTLLETEIDEGDLDCHDESAA